VPRWPRASRYRRNACSSRRSSARLQVTGQLSAQDLAALPPAALGRIADALRGAIASPGAPAALSAGDDDQDDEEVIEAVAAELDQSDTWGAA